MPELLNSDYKLVELLVTEKFEKIYGDEITSKNIDYEVVKEVDLIRAGSLKSNNSALAVAEIPDNSPLTIDSPGEFILAADDIRDPGNLGTIVRIADWYGIRKLICSSTCADFYNPKVLSATVGSFTRVKPYYCTLREYLPKLNVPIYGAFTQGKDVHRVAFEDSGVILTGNEAGGIRSVNSDCISVRVAIPKYGEAESLNAAVATGIICDNLMRMKNLPPDKPL